MYVAKNKMDADAEGSSPSAPPIVVAFEETTEHPLRAVPVQKKIGLSRDSYLVRDLLRKADGDTTKVFNWLEVMGETVSAEELKRIAEDEALGKKGDDVDAAAARLGAPETYFCPISFHLFRDPVLLQTGQTYERSVIQRWLVEGGSICPISGVQLPKPVILTPNYALRQAIEEWALKNADWMLGPNGRLLDVPEKDRRHFSLDNEQMSHDADTALAIHLQDEEVEHQRARRRRAGNPLRSDRRSELTPAQYERVRRCVSLLFVLTVVHLCMFIYTLYKGEWKFEKIDNNPLIGFEARVLRRAGCTDTYLISEKNEWWRIGTSALMTAGIVHLQWLLCGLWTCGRFLANRMSFVSIGLVYVVSSICGVLLSANFSTTYVTAGASGGVFGLIGAACVEILVHRKHYSHHLISFLFLILTATVGILLGTTPLVDNWTNLGGFVGGFCLALALRLTHRGLQGSICCMEWGLVAFQVFWFLVVGLFITAGIVGLFIEKGSRENCTWCKHLTCVNVDWWDCEVAVLPPDDVSCTFDIKGDLTTTVICPSGYSETLQLTDVSRPSLDRYCDDVCNVRSKRNSRPGAPSPPSNSSPGEEPGTIFVPPESPEDDLSSSLQQGNVEQSTTE